MNSKEFKSTALFEIPGKCGFDVRENKALLTYDYQLIEYDLVNHKKTGESMLETEVCAIAIHPQNSAVFAIGDLRVNTYDDVLMIAPSLIATLSGKVTCIQYSGNGKIMGIASEENQLVLYRDSRISRCKPGHDGMTLTCAFDPKERFVGSIGCDGCLIIYQMSQTPQLLHRYTISKPISPDVNQKLQSDFHPSGDSLWVAGQIYGQYIMTEDDPQELLQQYQITHKSEICIIKWIKENCLITASLDGEIKMWHFKSYTDLSLHWSFDIKSTPLFLRTNETTLFVLDSSCNLIETPLDAPLTNYEKVYKDTNSALQYLLEKKVKRKEHNMEEEELIPEEENEIQEKEIPKQKKVYQQAMQDVFRSGETPISKGRQYLCFNTVGTIISCRNTNMLEFEFFDSTFYKKFKMQNQQRFAYGTLNYRGCVLASRGPNDIDQDGYLAGEGKSIIRFQQFVGDVDDFEIQLPEEEGAEVLAMGNDWFAVLSDHGICRVIGFCGLELTQFQISRPIITMCAYEHLLCILYHDTSPIFNQQSIKARVYDVDAQCGVEEIEIYITPFSTLTWIGYSDEGMLALQDSKGAMRVYQNQRWIEIYRNPRQWLYGVQDYKLCLLKTDQPVAASRQEMIQVNFDCQITSYFEDEKTLQTFKQYLYKSIILTHEQYRWKEFGKYYYARNDDKQTDILVRYTQNLYDQNKIQELQHTLRKCRIDLFKTILSESKDKAIEFFRTHVKQDYDMNSIVSLLELQRDKQPTNKEITKLLAQIKLIQRQQLIKQQQHFVADNKQQSPKRKGFGLQKPMDINLKSVLEPTPQQRPLQQVSDQKSHSQICEDEQEEFNPFVAKSQPQKMSSIFDIGEKRKSNQTFGAQNIKKKV